ncbi:MAG: hypothetical protein HKN04_05865, partial [Rhodothermaceae bacterium]|nr:hypothetical protein [Rhodothermaceae bacterium]
MTTQTAKTSVLRTALRWAPAAYAAVAVLAIVVGLSGLGVAEENSSSNELPVSVRIDQLINAKLQQEGVEPAPLSSDTE